MNACVWPCGTLVSPLIAIIWRCSSLSTKNRQITFSNWFVSFNSSISRIVYYSRFFVVFLSSLTYVWFNWYTLDRKNCVLRWRKWNLILLVNCIIVLMLKLFMNIFHFCFSNVFLCSHFITLLPSENRFLSILAKNIFDFYVKPK